ncbi:MAG: hypothetical protein ACOYUB_04735 [Patescibacteria group bacterium]
MDSFNKIISFVLGLVVVIVFFAVVTGRINFKGGLPRLTKTSPTPTIAPTTTPSEGSGTKVVVNPTGTLGRYQQQSKSATQIPATGLPTLFIPSLLASAAGGVFLRKAGKK